LIEFSSDQTKKSAIDSTKASPLMLSIEEIMWTSLLIALGLKMPVNAKSIFWDRILVILSQRAGKVL
jgi:hypothetical protein